MEFNVNTSIPVHFEELEDIDDSRFLKAKVWICHTGINLNNSNLDKSVIEEAIPSLANVPILGFIQANSVNDLDFRGHEQRLIIDRDGVKIEYIGRSYGVVPETNNAQFEMKLCDDGIEREFLTAEVLLWRKFNEATDMIDNDIVKKQSMELHPPSIEGTFSKDGSFNFTKFKFEGLCLLGEDITPAMRGSVLEKFSELKTTSNFTEMLTEFNTYFTKLQKQEIDKGGENVDEKLELFTKYSTLSDEDTAELKANIENYSIEELETKLNEMFEKQKSNPEPSTSNTFSLTAQQMNQEIRKALATERFVDRWGDQVRGYWYIDHDDTRVYAEDIQDSYTPVGFNYVTDGDFVTIDFSTKKRIKFVPQDMEGEVDVSVSFVSIERNESDIEKVKLETTSTVTQSFETVANELSALKPQFETLTTANATLQDKLKTYESMNVEDLHKELENLKEFKSLKEKEEKIEIINKFSQLPEDELQTFKDNLDKFSASELELQLFALVGKKGLSFSSDKNKEPNLIFSLSDFSTSTNSSDLPAWAEYVEQYKSKQN